MPEFLAETYAPRGAPGTAAPRVSDAALDAEQLSWPGAPVRLLCAILVPEEETCFWLYRASSADAVRAAMTRTGLRPERIAPAVPVRPSRARVDRQPTRQRDPAAAATGPTGHLTRPAVPHVSASASDRATR